MLGAAGRAAGGLVKQAVKAGNVSNILPTASIARKYCFISPFYIFSRILLQPKSQFGAPTLGSCHFEQLIGGHFSHVDT